MNLYLEVTLDRYELPVAVADSLSELAEMTGFKKSYIATAISKYISGDKPNSQFRRVTVDDE